MVEPSLDHGFHTFTVKMVILPNFPVDRIFCKLKVSTDFQANLPKFREKCVF